MRPRARILCLILMLSMGCGGPEGPPPGTRPIKELLAEGKGPLEVVSVSRRPNPVMATFGIALKNVSDKPVKMAKWTMVFADDKGAPLAKDGQVQGGYAELESIAPGDTLEGIQGAPDGAVSARLVLESVVYESVPPGAEDNPSMAMMKLNLQWKNPRYAAELAGGK